MASTPSNNFDFQNYYSGTLQADITPSSLTLTLDVVPTPVEGILVIEPDSTTNREIIFFTSKTASTITCPSDGRGWDGTTAVTHTKGSPVIMAPVAYMLRMLKSGSLYDSYATGWVNMGVTPTYTSNDGNKQFTLSMPSDLTGKITPGMRIKYSRSVTPPTQAMSFTSSSSQYATKATPAGLTFTSAFTVEAWIYLNGYPGSSSQGFIVSRGDGTSNSWYLSVGPSGQLQVGYQSSAGYTEWDTYQVLPLGKWIHVAGSISSISSKTLSGMYINGVYVPTYPNGQLTTSLTNTGALQIGNKNGTTGYLNGYVSEARVWSVAQNQAAIQNNMAINLTGSETNLVGLWQGNGAWTDATTNANSLTATNGASFATSNPYNATEYGYITAITSSTMTIYTGNYSTFPNATVTNVFYSGQRFPYGFPSEDQWSLSAWDGTSTSQNIALRAVKAGVQNILTGLQYGNAASAAGGGYMYMFQTGLEKKISGTTGNLTVGANASTTWSVNFPSSFFNTVSSVTSNTFNLVTNVTQYSNVTSWNAGSVSGYIYNSAGASGSAGVSYSVMGI